MSTPHAVPAEASAPISDAGSRHLVLIDAGNTATPSSAGGRHLILIDAENMTATPSPTDLDVVWLKAALRLAIPDFDTVQCIVACSHHAAPVVAFEFPVARHLWQSGQDGADLALLDVLENEHVGQRYGRVTLCSGGGIFAAIVGRLGADVDTTVVAQEGRLALRLRLAAGRIILLPNTEWLFGTGDAS